MGDRVFNKVADYRVYITNDFAKFKILEGNRETESTGVLEKNIRKYGYLHVPILVNEFMEVIEGQHRLKACKKLGEPVHYIIQNGLRREHCIALNVGRRNWTFENYIHAGAVEKPEYRYFEILLQKYPDLPNTVVLSALDGTLTGGNAQKVAKEGGLKCSESDFNSADRICGWLYRFIPDIKGTGSEDSMWKFRKSIFNALTFAYRSKQIQIGMLEKSVHRKFYLFGKSVRDMADAVSKVEAIYNHGRLEVNKIDLVSEYRKAQRESKTFNTRKDR